MKIKFPVEAFALAMILTTNTLAEAVIVGVLVLFGTLAGMLARVVLGDEKRMQEVEVMITFFATFGSIYLINPDYVNSTDLWAATFTVVALGLLTAKFVWQAPAEMCSDYKGVVRQSVWAYIVLLVIAFFREFLGKGTLLGYDVLAHGLVATGYQHTFFGFIAAGFGIAFLNRILDLDSSEFQSELIIVPTALIAPPFAFKSLPFAFSAALSLFLVVIYLVSVKGRIMYSDTQEHYQAMPIELIAVGIVYMILSFF